MDKVSVFETNPHPFMAKAKELEHKLDRLRILFLLPSREYLFAFEQSLESQTDVEVEPTWCFDLERAMRHLASSRFNVIVVRLTPEDRRLEWIEALAERVHDTSLVAVRNPGRKNQGRQAIAKGALTQFSSWGMSSPAFGLCLRFAWYQQLVEHPLQAGAVFSGSPNRIATNVEDCGSLR